jgi:hypothetical protein
MQSPKNDVIYQTIDSYYKTNGGVGTDTISEIQMELKGLHSIDIDAGTLNKRIHDYLGSKFSGR